MNDDPLNQTFFRLSPDVIHDGRAATEGCIVTGSIGSSKSSGSAGLLAGHYLSSGMGMLVLCAKESEKDRWVKYCKKYEREEDLVIFSPTSGESFNFLEWEMKRADNGKGIASNIADVLITIIKSSNQGEHETDKAFWNSSLTQLFTKSIDLCLLTKNMRFEHIYDIIQSAPRTKKQCEDIDWQKSSKCFQSMHYVAEILEQQQEQQPYNPEVEKQCKRLKLIERFFYKSWLNLSEKTRSIIEQMVSSFGDRFLSPPLSDLFCTQTTIKPEDTIKGKVIVIDLPYLVYDKIGQDSAVLWKFLWQRCMQRRLIKKDSPLTGLFVDECQYFYAENDNFFQSTAREYRACTVYITQNLPNFYLSAGSGEIGKTRFKALAGNLNTKFFHANSDPETNTFAADLIGSEFSWASNRGKSFGEKFSFSSGQSETYQHIVPPSEFTKLKTGGPKNGFMAEAIVHVQGKIFHSTKANHEKITLNQILL